MTRWKMIDLKSQHFACVYKLIFPNGKIYVGKSKDIGKRIGLYERKVVGKWSTADASAVVGAIRLCGLDKLECEVLFKITTVYGVDWEKDLDYALGIVEMRWIRDLESNNQEIGYNGTEGGEMFGIRNLERVKEVEVEKKRIVYKDVVVERERQTNGVPVVGYDINGNFIGEWPSRVAFTREVIGSKGTLDYGVWRNGYIMYEKVEPIAERVESYAEYLERTRAAEIEANRVFEEKVGKAKAYRETKLNDTIVFVGKNGEEFERYDNIRDAAECTGISYSSIYICLKNGYGSAGGFRVFKAEDWDADNAECLRKSAERKVEDRKEKNEVREPRNRSSKYGKVYQYDRYFNEIGEYASMADAAEKTGLMTSSIYLAAKKGGEAFSGGYHWRFEADRVVKDAPKEDESAVEEPKQDVLFDDDDF